MKGRILLLLLATEKLGAIDTITPPKKKQKQKQ